MAVYNVGAKSALNVVSIVQTSSALNRAVSRKCEERTRSLGLVSSCRWDTERGDETITI